MSGRSARTRERAVERTLRRALPIPAFLSCPGSSDPQDSARRGKSAGLLIPAEHLPRFAVILAGAMKAEGQAPNTLGAALAVTGLVIWGG